MQAFKERKRRQKAARAAEAERSDDSKHSNPNGKSNKSMWQKALTRGGQFDKETFEELPVVVHWARQALAILIGLACGVAGVEGVLGFGLFFGINLMLVRAYCQSFLDVELEDFPGIMYKEGMMPAFGLFVATWTIAYTLSL